MILKEFCCKFISCYRKSLLSSKLSALAGKDIPNRKWIFIVGCYNSGTTLLNQILSSHPVLSGFPNEGVLLIDPLVRPEDFSSPRMSFKCEEAMKYSSGRIPKSLKMHWSHFYDLKKPFNWKNQFKIHVEYLF